MASFLKNGVNFWSVKSLKEPGYDGVLLVTYPQSMKISYPEPLRKTVESVVHIDKGLETEVSVVPCDNAAGGKIIISPTGAITPYHDVRSVMEAAKKGMNRALKSGVKSPLVVVQSVSKFEQNELVTLLGALEALYVPIQVRECGFKNKEKFQKFGVYYEGDSKKMEKIIQNAIALEEGRIAGRDIAGGDPERMSAMKVEEYVKENFSGFSNLKIEVISDIEKIKKEFPLFAAVNRAAHHIERHRGRVILLTYTPDNVGNITDTVILVGKGVTYDTGGADIKAGGNMAGMSRDKSGAGAVAGFMKTCALLKPQHVKVIAALCMARNSVGEDCYVSDELLVSRSGKLIRIGNTDAEGRMVMTDLVCMLKDQAKTEKNPHIYTVATLTGHAIKAVGVGYSVCIDNFAARNEDHARKLQQSGNLMGDMFEISTLRREDFAAHRGTFEGDDVLQSLYTPSVANCRGHQGPAAFIVIASGLEEENIKFSHIDMAPSAGIVPVEPTASPLLALAQHYKIFN